MSEGTTSFVIREDALEKLQHIELEALHKIAERVKEEAKANAPVKTGKLRDSIAILDEDLVTKTVTIGTEDTGYALYLELGTSKQASHPFLRPAMDITLNTKLEGI